MIETIQATLRVMKASAHLLAKDKELVFFPIVSGFLTFLLIAALVAPELANLSLEGLAAKGDDSNEAGDASQHPNYVVLFLIYLAVNLIATFFNCALIACAFKRMDGGNPTIGYGLDMAVQQVGHIMGWALVASTVGLVLRMIEDRSRGIGDFIADLLGFAWSMASFLALSILVARGIGPFEALKDSTRLLKETWGEQLAGRVGFWLVGAILSVVGFFVISILAFLIGKILSAAVFWIVAWIIYSMALGIVISTLAAIYQAALYRYVELGITPEDFDSEELAGSITPAY